MTSEDDLLKEKHMLAFELENARTERNIMTREVVKLQQQVEMLKASFWIAHHGFHLAIRACFVVSHMMKCYPANAMGTLCNLIEHRLCTREWNSHESSPAISQVCFAAQAICLSDVQAIWLDLAGLCS